MHMSTLVLVLICTLCCSPFLPSSICISEALPNGTGDETLD